MVDVVVVGGGILGAGLLQACQAHGWMTVGLEARSIAAATSRASSKLIHGGLRYLETQQFRLVRESLRERRLLRQLAPDLVRLVPFHIPVYRDSTRSPGMIRAGLSLYALLGGLRAPNRFQKIPRSQWDRLDGLTTDDLRAVYRYLDGQTDDAALTRAVIASAESLGAEFRCPAEFVRSERKGATIEVTVREGEREEIIETKALVLAPGPWWEEARARCTPELPPLPVDLVQGAHLELEGTVDAGIYYLEAPSDRRPVFVMPWRDRTLVGTTELLRHSPTECAPSDEEIAYLESVVARYFPEREIVRRDAWAGCRVLERATGSANTRSREAVRQVVTAEGTITLAISGGKLTGYRSIAVEQVKTLAEVLPERAPRARTDELPLRDPQRTGQLATG